MKKFNKLRSIFKANPELINLTSELSQDSLLHTAIIHRYSSNVIKFLIQNGIDTTLWNKKCQTAYHIATSCEMEDFEKLVNVHPAGLNTLDAEMDTPLNLICRDGNLEMLAFVLKFPGIRTDVINEAGITAMTLTNDASIQYMLKKYNETGICF